MALTSSQQSQLVSALVSHGYNQVGAQNEASGPRADELFREHVGGGSGTSTGDQGSGNPLQDVNNLISDSFTKLTTEAAKKFGDYQSSHPFALDQVLASSLDQAKEQVDPYYKETLSNYLTGVTRRIARSKGDTQNILNELGSQTESYTRDTKLKLADALDQANQGFADSGLLNSGANLKATGQLQVNTGNSLADYLRQQAYKGNQTTLQNDNTVKDINTESTQQERDIARSQYTDEQSRANQLTQEAGQQYVRGFQQTLPPQLQANSGFDLLKQLGIPG